MNNDRNSDRSSARIQAEIQRTRNQLDRTLTLLERRLEPRRLVDQGIDYLRSNGASEYLSSLGRSARQQPMPLALVGVGLAWMMVSNGRGSDGATDRTALADAAQRTSQGFSDAAEAARARAAQVGEATRQGAQKLRSGYDQIVNEQPLALGAIGLALGAVLAAAAPRTEKEDALMGSASDELAADAKRSTRELFSDETPDAPGDTTRPWPARPRDGT